MSRLGLSFVSIVLLTGPAHAYIGPGAGAGTIAVVLGVLGAIAMAFFAVLWYPVKRLVKGRKAAKVGGNAEKDSK